MRQRRRAERGNFNQLRDRSQPVVSKREIENKQRQLLIVGAAAVVAIVLGLLAYGWFTSSFQPPRKAVATIAGEPVKLADLVSYTALDSFDTGGTLRPDTALNNLVRDRVVARQAGTIGIVVTDDEVSQKVIERFETPIPGATETADELTQAGRAALDIFLAAFSVTEDQYYEWLRGRIYLDELQIHFNEAVPESAEQVFAEWIITVSSVTAQEALDRITAGETFADVADDLTGTTSVSGEGGVLGWVPPGAFFELDSLLFSEELVLDEIMGPLTTSFGSMLLKVSDGPEEQPINDAMRTLVGNADLQEWLDAQVVEAVVEDLGLTPDDSTWVVDQIV